MKELAFATIKELREKIDRKEISAKELLQFFIKRFEAHDMNLESALEIFDAESTLQASSGKGSLHGIPGILKDNIAQEDRRLTCASRILENFISPFDATVSKRLKQEGALLVGRSNCDEFAMGSSTETSAFKKTKNPWDNSRVPGGSSGGSAAAVAAGLVPWALGSDTGGSIRQPAAFCGIVGSKPTYGLVSRYGLVAYGSSLDQIGVFSRSVYDNALVYSVMAGHDAHDSTTLPVAKKDYTKKLHEKLPDNFTIGIVENALNSQGIDDEIKKALHDAIAVFEKLGVKTKKIQLPTMDYSAAVYFIISRAEAASNLSRFDGVRYGLRDLKADTLEQMYSNTRHDGFGTEVKARILVGNYVLSAGYSDKFYLNAKKVRSMMRQELMDAFKDVQLLLMPTHPAPAFKLGAYALNKLQMDLQDYFTCFANLTGVPAISLPCGISKEKLPIGFQLVGPHLGEQEMFHAAHIYEQETEWHTLHPKGF
jgi:aspartyl-tRNA(Asn)/glutamyl-tRNA(Gln) amidotransferase subunit A